MLFNSFAFLFVFLPVTLLGFYFIAAKYKKEMAILWLVLMSLVFYGYWNPLYLPLIILLMSFNYGIGMLLGKDTNPLRRKLILAFGIITDLAFLGYFKYANFFVDQYNGITGGSFNLDKIILPLAISFFTFQKIAYLVDAYRHETKEYNFLHFSLFVTFFPQLIAGPIVHHKEIMPQFNRVEIYKWSARNISIGLSIFAIGLFKKTIFADGAAGVADTVFNSTNALTFFDAWMGAIAYSLQLYFDFSGYSDMAIGAAYMFGIYLPLNFDSPYKSKSIIDFWHRWHMTLSRFLRDYVYFSLGGSRKGSVRRYINLFLTMLIGGFWHGAGWPFIIWGALHGTYLIINHAWRKVRSDILKISSEPKRLETILSRILTLLAILVGWVYFRATTLEQGNHLIATMIGYNGVSVPAECEKILGDAATKLASVGLKFDGLTLVAGMYPSDMIIWIVPLIIIAFFFPNSNQILRQLELLNSEKMVHPVFVKVAPFIVAILLFAAVSTFMSVSQFLYFNF